MFGCRSHKTCALMFSYQSTHFFKFMKQILFCSVLLCYSLAAHLRTLVNKTRVRYNKLNITPFPYIRCPVTANTTNRGHSYLLLQEETFVVFHSSINNYPVIESCWVAVYIEILGYYKLDPRLGRYLFSVIMGNDLLSTGNRSPGSQTKVRVVLNMHALSYQVMLF